MRPPVTVWSLAVAVVGLAAAGYFWWENQRLETRLAQTDRQLADVRRTLRRAEAGRDELHRQADELDTQLGAAKTSRTATETKNVLLARELTAARESLTTREQREVALMAELATLKRQPADQATTVPHLATADAEALQRRITDLEGQLVALLTRALEAPPPLTAPASVSPASPQPSAPSPPRVVRVGPHGSFVVLAYGSLHGAAYGQQLALRQGTSPIARVQISAVRPAFSVAQVLPGTLTAQLRIGDLVVLPERP